MSTKKRSVNKKDTLGVEDYILYILNHLEPDRSDKIRLNKIAFFVEFAYLFYNEKALSDAEYAAINKGAVINDYDTILRGMQRKGKVKMDGYKLRPLASPEQPLQENISLFIDPLIKKYSSLTNDELIQLSHATDSFKITTDNEKMMGLVIDKKLAALETFFEEEEEEPIDESRLPVVNKEKLIRYEPR